MESSIFLKFEIIIMFISFWYIIYYVFDRMTSVYSKVKKIITPSKKIVKKEFKKINIASKEANYKKDHSIIHNLSHENKDKLIEILKRVKLNRTKWYFDVARTLIVEWLAIDKYNKDLNLELAKIYEIEKKYKNGKYF